MRAFGKHFELFSPPKLSKINVNFGPHPPSKSESQWSTLLYSPQQSTNFNVECRQFFTVAIFHSLFTTEWMRLLSIAFYWYLVFVLLLFQYNLQFFMYKWSTTFYVSMLLSWFICSISFHFLSRFLLKTGRTQIWRS